MILGIPDKFAIIIEIVDEWNDDDTFNNGVLMYCVNWEVYPKSYVANATLSFELWEMKKSFSNIGIDERIFNLPKEEAFTELYKLRFPDYDNDVDEDYHFDISPTCFSDNNCYIFAVSNGKQIRILAVSDLEYIVEESTHNLENIEIGETYISVEEMNEIISKLNI